MAKEIKVAAYEEGKIHTLVANNSGNEAVLALPLNRLVIKVLKVPADVDPVEFATPILKAASPYPDDDLAVGIEVMREDEKSKVVIAAALPESSADDIGEALDEAKLSVVKIDALILGELRFLWPKIFINGADTARRLLVVQGTESYTLIVLDGDQIVSLRCIDIRSALRREIILALIEAEDFAGERTLGEVLLLKSAQPFDGHEELCAELRSFAELREVVRDDEEAALRGVADRALEEGTLDALPESWRDVLNETRFKIKFTRWMSLFVGILFLLVGVLFGVPIFYDLRTSSEKDKCRRHRPQYQEVKEMMAKVDLVTKYSDHSTGALAVMKAVSDRLPSSGVTIERYVYKFDDSLTISAVADSSKHVYDYHDALEEIMIEAEDGEERLFKVVSLKNLKSRSAKTSEQSFTIECKFHKDEEVEE